jgi:positive regulator of sigma E activity
MKLKVKTSKKVGAWKFIFPIAALGLGTYFLLIPAIVRKDVANIIMMSVLSLFLIFATIRFFIKFIKKEDIKSEMILKDVESYEEIKEEVKDGKTI